MTESIYFYKTADGLLIQTVGTETTSVTIPFSNIVTTVKKRHTTGDKIMITFKDYKPYEFYYSHVAVPATSNATALMALIESYDLPYAQPEYYIATDGQSDFVTDILLGSAYQVFIDGLLQDPKDYSYDTTTQTLSFDSPLIGGEQVAIININ